MSTHTCPHCRGPLQLTLSGRYAYCHACALELNEPAYAPIGHNRPHPTGRTLGQAARDEGAARVLENAGQEWRDRIAFLIDGLARRLPDLTADDVRAEVERTGMDQPHHVNAYGAAMLAAARRGSIRRTMQLRYSERPEAHSHGNPIWDSLIYEPEAQAPGHDAALHARGGLVTMNISACRACGAQIVFMPRERRDGTTGVHPVDAATVEPGDSRYDRERHVSHFDTCPDAERFRRAQALRPAAPKPARQRRPQWQQLGLFQPAEGGSR